MSSRSFLLAIAIFTLLGAGAGAGLCLLVRYEPRPYAQAEVAPGEVRYQKSQEFTEEFTHLVSALGGQQEQEGWDARFTDEQINSYFSEGFVTSGLEEKLLPEGISQPRVLIDTDRIRLAFRYGSGFWSSVVSIDVKVWVPKEDPNALALQLVGFHAGALPISAQSFLERVSEAGRHHGIDVNWYRYEGRPTAVVRFQAEPRPTIELQAVHLGKGVITIQGRCTDGPVGALVPTPAGLFKPQTE
jgi:hypothetical protein